MWHMSDGWGWWIVFGAAWWLIIWATVAMVGTRLFGGAGRARSERAGGDAIAIAERRFAAGEISAAQLAEIRAELAKAPFIAYPTDYLFGIVDDASEARAAVQEMESAGIAEEDVSVFTGETGALRIDASGARHGVLARAVRLLEAMSMNADHAGQYEDAAREGRNVIAMHAHGGEDKAKAQAILAAHHGHFINYYARMHFETLVP